jgi:hypothetical protein
MPQIGNATIGGAICDRCVHGDRRLVRAASPSAWTGDREQWPGSFEAIQHTLAKAEGSVASPGHVGVPRAGRRLR